MLKMSVSKSVKLENELALSGHTQTLVLSYQKLSSDFNQSLGSGKLSGFALLQLQV